MDETQIQPNQILLDSMGVLTDTLGKVEHEAVAALIVRWHHLMGHETWKPVTRAALGELITDDVVAANWGRNPFWRPSPYEFSEAGFITGWGPDPLAPGTLTEKFHTGILRLRRRQTPGHG